MLIQCTGLRPTSILTQHKHIDRPSNDLGSVWIIKPEDQSERLQRNRFAKYFILRDTGMKPLVYIAQFGNQRCNRRLMSSDEGRFYLIGLLKRKRNEMH